MISGKTYQNLFDMKNLNYDYYDTLTDDGYKNINIPELSTGYKVCKSAVNNLIKANTVYTIIIDVRKNTFNKNFGINSDYNNEGYFSKNIAIQQNFIGRMIVTATSKETLPSNSQKVFRTQITPDSLGELEFKLMLLEGDYTNTDLPTSIDGIESVGEKEDNLVTIRNYNYKCDTDNIVLPNGVKNSIETIDGKKVHIQRVAKILLDGSNANNFKQVNNMQVFRWEYFFEIKDFISGLCDKFPIKNVESLINENKGIRLSGTSFRGIDIKFPDNAGFNINTFKTWLSENPITVWYELATPLYTYLESGLYDDITIPTSNIKNEIYLEKWEMVS